MQIHTEPFTYITADDFLPPDVFDYMLKLSQDDSLDWEINGDQMGTVAMKHLYLPDDFPLPFHDNMNQYLTHHRPYSSLKRRTYISKQRGPFQHKVHCETEPKVFSHVVYLGPEKSIGTILHDRDKKPCKVVPWKLNRAFIFAGETDVTWHSYATIGDEVRVTLNSFYERPIKDV